jgi:peptide/nickel transport system substrate-binding protein
MGDARQALDALRAGECDVLDDSLHLETLGADLKTVLEDKGFKVLARPGAGIELLDFGLLPAQTPENGGPLPLFNLRETRQALAQCIDRQKLADTIPAIAGAVPLTYVSPAHPLANKDARAWAFEPQAANQALEAAGWKDTDSNPSTPRISQGVNGVPDGTAFRVSLMIGDAPEKQRLGTALQEMLAGCGMQVDLDARPADVIYAAGPNGPIFGRQFSLAQFGWAAGIEPGCALFTTSEIPGAYPEFPRGWGGANAGGYSNPDFDRWCKQAGASLPEWPGYSQAHQQAQAIFAEDVPALPLYTSARLVIARSDLCLTIPAFVSESALYDVENFQIGTVCP